MTSMSPIPTLRSLSREARKPTRLTRRWRGEGLAAPEPCSSAWNTANGTGWAASGGRRASDEPVTRPSARRSGPRSTNGLTETPLQATWLRQRLLLHPRLRQGCRFAVRAAPHEQDLAQGALSRCHAKSASGLRLTDFQAAATASRHVIIAAARSTRCDLADVRWRWTLKVL